MSDATVALLGTGTMGAGMARNIAAAGLDLRVWNRTRDKAEPLADIAEVRDTPEEAVAGADLVVTMLYDADSVAETIAQAQDGLADDVVWIQTSTVGVAGAIRLEGLAADLGVGYVDAPVLGTRKPAEDGTLTVLASGDSALRERVAPVLDAIGSRTLWVGPAAAGSRLKLACNAWTATAIEGVAESLAIAEALGLDPALFLEALEGSPLDSPFVQAKGAMMLGGEYPPSFTVAGVVKDLGLILEATADTDFSPRLLPVIHEQFVTAAEQGLADRDMAAVYASLDDRD